MKNKTGKCVILFACILFFAFCKNPAKNNGAENSNPIFKSQPALQKITEQIIKSPADAELYYRRGEILQGMQLDSLAVKDYIKASDLDTNKAMYYSAVGNLLFENKDITGSLKWIQKAIAKNPEDPKARLKMAKLFLYIGNHQKAIDQINIVLRKNVYSPEAYFLKGMVFKDMKDTAKAISNFMTAKEVGPEYRDAYLQLGLLFSNKKDPIALKYLDDAFALDSNDVFPIYARGVFYQSQNDFVSAKQEFRKCILKNSHYVDAYFNMGYMLMQQDSVQKAYRQYDIATRIDYANPTAYYNRGVCGEMMDSIKQAIADYKKALTLDTGYNSPKVALKRLKVKF